MNTLDMYIKQKEAAIQIGLLGMLIGFASYFVYPETTTILSFCLLYFSLYMFFDTMEGAQ